MNPGLLPLLCDPTSHEKLELRFEPSAAKQDAEILVNPSSGRTFPVRDGIPSFAPQSEVSGQNAKYQKLYDRLAPGFDFAEKAFFFIARQDPAAMRKGYLDEVEMKGRVLEVSIGTGANLPYFPPSVDYIGLDISWGMLKKCRRNLARWKREAALVQGTAEYLPFRDGAFDTVFHMGGINFFNDRARAIQEMIRVAQPGTKIVIADETEKTVKDVYEKSPFTSREYKNRTRAVSAPLDLVPPGMIDLNVKEICKGKLYCMTFRKPL